MALPCDGKSESGEPRELPSLRTCGFGADARFNRVYEVRPQAPLIWWPSLSIPEAVAR